MVALRLRRTRKPRSPARPPGTRRRDRVVCPSRGGGRRGRVRRAVGRVREGAGHGIHSGGERGTGVLPAGREPPGARRVS
ncbi:MAG: hypothetical protein AMS19_00380 [Gemmatimonas sp. SG8_23]|nr:MAG: hypothetical protein AMS19_00380 [Gemmatimonas sp. SG8_23]